MAVSASKSRAHPARQPAGRMALVPEGWEGKAQWWIGVRTILYRPSLWRTGGRFIMDPMTPPGRPPSDDERWLYEQAVGAMSNAYARYSHFSVGAALVTRKMGPLSNRPQPVLGANVENASYGMTICAERVAVGTALATGHCPEAVEAARRAAQGEADVDPRCITAIAVATSPHVATCSPCGACRQVLEELSVEEGVAVICIERELRVVPIHELLPVPFAL